VAKGFEQREGLDFQEIFFLVIKQNIIRSVVALAAHFGWKISQMDVKTMFLNGDIQEEVYLTQLEGFVQTGKEDLVCKLSKTLYGL
jgi:hypothetical protein